MKIFRHIFQKCSGIHQGFPALFGSSGKKFSDAIYHLSLCGITEIFTEKIKDIRLQYSRDFAII